MYPKTLSEPIFGCGVDSDTETSATPVVAPNDPNDRISETSAAPEVEAEDRLEGEDDTLLGDSATAVPQTPFRMGLAMCVGGEERWLGTRGSEYERSLPW